MMASQKTILHIRVDEQLKLLAMERLAGIGLTVSDAVRILLTRVAREGGLPAGLVAAAEVPLSPAPPSPYGRRVLLESVRASAARKSVGQADAARSQDFLYGDYGLPE